MKRKISKDRYISIITRKVENLTTNISDVKAQRTVMIKSESDLQNAGSQS